jgi:hypothetical protein
MLVKKKPKGNKKFNLLSFGHNQIVKKSRAFSNNLYLPRTTRDMRI